MNKKIIIFFAMILVIVVASFFWWKGTPPQPPKYSGPVEKITLGEVKSEDAALILVAQDKGFFAENGLEVTLKDYQSGGAGIKDLVAGSIDIVTAGEFAVVNNIFNNDSLRIIATIRSGEGIELIARRDKGVSRIVDLNGKKIGVTKKTGPEFALGTFLTFNNLALSDVTIVDLSPTQLVEGISKGEVDAVMIFNPFAYNIKKQLGDTVVSWSGQSGQKQYFNLITRKELVDSQPEIMRRLLLALQQAETFVADNPKQTQDLLTKQLQYEQPYLAKTWTNHHLALSLDQSLLLSMEDEARWAIKNKLTDKTSVPNYLNYIYFDAMEKVKPEAITIVH